jgi:hypothetical protein
MPNVQPQFLQFLSHPGPPIGLQAKAVLFADMRQDHHIVALSAAHPLSAGDACIAERGRLRHARYPRDVTCITRHKNATGHSSFQASIKANLIPLPGRRCLHR